MTKWDRCPICDVTVKSENLIRHVNDTHPHHPDTPLLRERLKAESGRVVLKKAAAPIRVRKWHVAVLALVVLGGVGIYYLAPYFSPGASQPFPCATPPIVYHWHTQLTIFSGGAQVTIPADVGVSPGCHQPLHTHDTTGQIHIESDVNRLYTIGDFFLVWRKSFGSPTQMLVNRTSISPSAGITLDDGQTVELHYASFA